MPVLVSLAVPASASAHGDDPAGGAALWEVAVATGGALFLTALLVGLGLAHRSGRTQVLERAAAAAERQTGLPGWSALPGAISLAALLVALLGMYWDISLHIDQGRDPGPLANPAHYLILGGLFGVFAAGIVACVLPRERPGASAVRITDSWHVPLGGVLLLACSAFSLSGFPLDDVWHRLFGQDVTLWGPTHLMLFGGAGLTLIGRAVLMVEGTRAAREAGSRAKVPFVRFQRAALIGGFLIGLSTFQGEFDFGVPQFRLLFQPMLIVLAAGIALVTARIWAGRGGALVAVGLFIAIRGGVSLLVGPVLGETLPHFPLYLAEAALVELVALRVSPQRPLTFGVAAGALIGTVGLAAEWGWSHLWMPLPWPESLLPEAALVGIPVAIAAGVIGGLIGAALNSDRVALPRRAGLAAAAAGVVVVAAAGYALHTPTDEGLRAQVTLSELPGGGGREVAATIEVEPRAAADEAEWLTVTAWQGGGLVVDRLERVGPGVFRTTEPIPVHGEWKALVRLHRGDSLLGLPLYLPEDRAIPAAAVPARPEMTRPFVADKEILQREAKDASGSLAAPAYLTVLAIAALLLAALTWGLRRLALDGRARRDEAPPRRPAKAPGPRLAPASR